MFASLANVLLAFWHSSSVHKWSLFIDLGRSHEKCSAWEWPRGAWCHVVVIKRSFLLSSDWQMLLQSYIGESHGGVGCGGGLGFVVVAVVIVVIFGIFSTYIKLSVSKSKAVWAIALHYSCSCLDDASNLSALFTAGCNLHPFTQMKIHERRGQAFRIQDQGRNLHFLRLLFHSLSRASFFILIYTYEMKSDGNFWARCVTWAGSDIICVYVHLISTSLLTSGLFRVLQFV